MPTQYDMVEGDVLYRAILEQQVQPTRRKRNPNYDPTARYNHPMYTQNEMWKEYIYVPDGPLVWQETMIGPYKQTSPIKSHVTRHRSRSLNGSLRIKRVERVSAWEEVTI